MNNQLLEEITSEYLQEKRDHFKVGDGVKVHVKVGEGEKEAYPDFLVESLFAERVRSS